MTDHPESAADPAVPREIHWSADMDPDRRAELSALARAFDDALTDFEADPAALFASPGERNGVFYAFLKRWDRIWSRPGPCMHDGCAQTSIARSHTISLGASIRRVAEAGHVLTQRYGETGIELIPIGVKEASTFPGFCAEHEQLFAAFETQKAMTEEQHYRLQAFRTICREIYSKEHQAQKGEAMLAEHRARRDAFVRRRLDGTQPEQAPLKVSLTFENDDLENRLVDHLASVRADLPELRGLYDGLLAEIRNGGDHVEMRVINLDLELPVCLSGFGVLNYRYRGEARRGLCFLAILPEDGRTKIIIGADKAHAAAVDLHIADDGSFAVLAMLESWMIHGTDHWFIRPSAWAAILEPRRQAICERLIEPLSLADRAPFSVLDGPREAILGLGEEQLRSGGIPADHRPIVEQCLSEERAKLAWSP